MRRTRHILRYAVAGSDSSGWSSIIAPFWQLLSVCRIEGTALLRRAKFIKDGAGILIRSVVSDMEVG